MRALWLVNQLWFIVAVNPPKNRASSELPYESNRPQVSMGYRRLYNNQNNARAVIGQSAMVYCAGKPTEKSCVLWIII